MRVARGPTTKGKVGLAGEIRVVKSVNDQTNIIETREEA